MAKVEVKTTKRQVTKFEDVKEFVLTLTEDEAEGLRALVGRTNSSGAVDFQSVYDALGDSLKGLSKYEVEHKASGYGSRADYQTVNGLRVVER